MLELIVILTILLIANIVCLITDKNKVTTPKIMSDGPRKLTSRDLSEIRDVLYLMDSREFEVFCSNLYSLLGYKSIVTKSTADGGKDVVLNDGEIFVECKHYFKDTIGRPIAQKLYGAMSYSNFIKEFPSQVSKGIIFTTTKFSDECIEYCSKMNIELVDFDGIMELVKQVGTDDVLKIAGLYIPEEQSAAY